MKENKFTYNERFYLENGKYLSNLEITYHTAGKISENQDNIIWVCHALTANSDVCDWWSDLVGAGKLYDPARYFIICANILGSCYGTTSPLSVNVETGKPYYHSYPDVTVKDIVRAHELLRNHLRIEKIHTVIGGSIGGFQSLEWAISSPDLFQHLIFIASSAKVSPWATAFNESQRMALLADKTFEEERPDAGAAGLAAARSIALLSYRNANTYNSTQFENDNAKYEDLRASSYQRYQGEKLVKRFNAFSYYKMTKVIDSQNVGRNRGGVENALKLVKAKTLVVAISSDILFPIEAQKLVHKHITNSEYVEINSNYGHDGFLIEWEALTNAISFFYEKPKKKKSFRVKQEYCLN